MYEVIFYENEKGQCPTDEFLDTLPPKVRAKLEKWIEKLETSNYERRETI